MKCTFCTRSSLYQLGSLNLCKECSDAFREGFEKGKVYEAVRRRNHFKNH